jgi:hypothetical protein
MFQEISKIIFIVLHSRSSKNCKEDTCSRDAGGRHTKRARKGQKEQWKRKIREEERCKKSLRWSFFSLWSQNRYRSEFGVKDLSCFLNNKGRSTRDTWEETEKSLRKKDITVFMTQHPDLSSITRRTCEQKSKNVGSSTSKEENPGLRLSFSWESRDFRRDSKRQQTGSNWNERSDDS